MHKRKDNIPLVLVFHSSVRAPWSEAYAGMSAFARETGWKMQLVEDGNLNRPLPEEVKRMIQFWNPIGCIVECGCDVKGQFSQQMFAECPCVFMNPVSDLAESTASVTHDNRKIGEMAVCELMSQGLTRLAFLGFSDYRWSVEREKGFAQALAPHRVTYDQYWVPTEGESWSAYVERPGFSQFLMNLPKPCGLFAANDLLAESALNVCRKNRIAVPDDIAVIGVDNDVESCESAIPTLSSIQIHFMQQGYCVASYLGELIAGKAMPEARLFDSFSVVRRQSTRCLAPKVKDAAAMLEFIRLNACNGISSKDVFTRFASRSRRRAEQRFRFAAGHSVLDEINAVRIERAKELLGMPDCPIESIAEQCGFRSSAHLRVLFRRNTGMSMREWRKSQLL